MPRNVNKDNQETKQEVVKMIKEQFNTNYSSGIKIEPHEPHRELCKPNSLKVITNVCQNLFENATIAHKPTLATQKVKTKTKKLKKRRKTTKVNCKNKKIELALVEEQINRTPKADTIISRKQEVENSKRAINDCIGSIKPHPEGSINLLKLMHHRERRSKEPIMYPRDEIKNNTNANNNKNKSHYSESEESDDFQEFLKAVGPKRAKYKPRQKPQLTEEQKAENERQKLERRTCTICKIVFAFPGGLRTHIRSKHTLEKPYSCEICGEHFSIQSSYSLHRRRHLGIKPHLCNLCGKTYLRRMDLRIHMRIHIPSKDKIRDVKCAFCSNVYTSKINLRKHVLTKHTEPSEWKHECHVCDKKCFSATALTHHIRQHNDDRKFKCVICGRGFFTKQNMNVHVRTHSASTSFNCQHCSSGYRSNEALQRHMLKVHGVGEEKPVSAPTHFCRVCKEGFRQRARLEQHLVLHETGVEEYPYQCKKCDRRYKARNYFTIHMMDKHGVFIDDAYFKTHFKMPKNENSAAGY